jgi:hypothetical protein
MVNDTLRPLRWILFLPVVLVGSLLYWSVALGLGGMSLIAASALSTGAALVPGPTGVAEPDEASAAEPLAPNATIEITDGTAAPILVHLEESAEPEDVNDNTGAVSVAPAADDATATKTGPGSTSY